jgi:hypothetical protein
VARAFETRTAGRTDGRGALVRVVLAARAGCGRWGRATAAFADLADFAALIGFRLRVDCFATSFGFLSTGFLVAGFWAADFATAAFAARAGFGAGFDAPARAGGVLARRFSPSARAGAATLATDVGASRLAAAGTSAVAADRRRAFGDGSTGAGATVFAPAFTRAWDGAWIGAFAAPTVRVVRTVGGTSAIGAGAALVAVVPFGAPFRPAMRPAATGTTTFGSRAAGWIAAIAAVADFRARTGLVASTGGTTSAARAGRRVPAGCGETFGAGAPDVDSRTGFTRLVGAGAGAASGARGTRARRCGVGSVAAAGADDTARSVARDGEFFGTFTRAPDGGSIPARSSRGPE